MERILRDNEKIRKAEEIYYRRNRRNIAMMQEKKERKPKTYLGSKILLEMLVLVLLTVTVFAVKNREYIFSESFLNYCAQYNINLSERFAGFIDFLKEEEEVKKDEIFVTSDTEDPVDNSIQEKREETINNEETIQVVEVQGEENQSNLQQNVITDSISLKSSYSFEKPLEGIITAVFGSRESLYQNSTGAHTGIDLAADRGTKIKAAMSGKVTQVSTEGDYGNHIRITRDNITTLYAHCKDIYVAEGQEIIEGQEIASVGSTGNSTGPHLHFEIRIDDKPINPAEIIDF